MSYCPQCAKFQTEIANLRADLATVIAQRDALREGADVVRAELAAAKARIAQRDAQIAVYNIGGFADADALAERYLSVVNELAAAKADAELYRWLEPRISGREWRELGIVYGEPSEIRSRIDAAIGNK